MNNNISKLENREDIEKMAAELKKQYEQYQALSLKIDMQRGRPCSEQSDISTEILDWHGSTNYITESGIDVRNYGGAIQGTMECRRLFADILGIKPENVLVWGNSSLNIMYDCIVKALLVGVYGGSKPWLAQEGKLKFLCPVPGYDRHFGITEHFGFEMINIEMDENGPDMDLIERLVSEDDSIKGIWNVPKYSNPGGITYSDEVVRRFAALKPKADDFRIFWDDSYCVHDLYDDNQDKLLNILDEAKKYGNEDLVYIFMSTSKITLAGAGVAVIAASENNIKFLGKQFAVQSISADKVNQIRHALFLKDAKNLKEVMRKHATIIRPKFEEALAALEEEFADSGICSWNKPKGGYFISVDTPDFCATRAVQLAAEAGILFTGAGATFPYKKDPRDRNIRIAPTVPTVKEIGDSVRILATCIKIAYLENKLTALA